MHGKFKMRALLLAMLLGLGAGNVRATTFLQFQSTYLGDGWFQYQMHVVPDPFFTEQDITSLTLLFTNQIAQVGGTNGWVCTETNTTYGYADWVFTNGIPVPPYTETFLMRSAAPSFRLSNGSNYFGAMVVVSLVLSEFNPDFISGGGGGNVYFQNIVGYAKMPCLIPCQPEEADGSPTNYVFTLKLLPDVDIQQLVQQDGGICGVDFLWDRESTFLLQGSADFKSWTNIAYIWSYPPETEWTTNRLLGDFGNFFRLALVAGSHTTNLPPLNTATQPAPLMVKTKASVPTATTPRVTSFKVAHGTVEVNVATQAGQAAQVQAVDRKGTVLQTRRLQPKGTSDTATFGAASLPEMVFFRASPL